MSDVQLEPISRECIRHGILLHLGKIAVLSAPLRTALLHLQPLRSLLVRERRRIPHQHSPSLLNLPNKADGLPCRVYTNGD